MSGSQDFAADPRNETIRIYVNGDLVPRSEAKVSIFDAGFVLGDGIWEGIRLHRGRLVFLDAHLDRLFDGARTLDLDIGLTRAEMEAALQRTVAENGMEDGAHLRLMVIRKGDCKSRWHQKACAGFQDHVFSGTKIQAGSTR